MSKTTTALLIKLAMTFIAAWLAFSVFDGAGIRANPLGWILLVSLIGTAANYLVGDLMVLPAYGNITAALGDGITAALVAYIINLFTPRFSVDLSSLVFFAVLVAVAEYFFHRYLLKAEEVSR